jgi:hypothetical protein
LATAGRSSLELSLDPRIDSDEPRSEAEPALEADDAALEADVARLSASADEAATPQVAATSERTTRERNETGGNRGLDETVGIGLCGGKVGIESSRWEGKVRVPEAGSEPGPASSPASDALPLRDPPTRTARC